MDPMRDLKPGDIIISHESCTDIRVGGEYVFLEYSGPSYVTFHDDRGDLRTRHIDEYTKKGQVVVKDTLAATVSDGSSTGYYKLPEGATDLLDLIDHKAMGFGVGNIFKACYRLGEKSGTDVAYDLRKIIFFANRELSRVMAASEKSPA